MRLIDADEFLENNKELADCYFVHPKYCDTLRDLVNNAPTVDVLEQIREEIEDYVCNKEKDTAKAQGMLNALQIIDRHMKGDSE